MPGSNLLVPIVRPETVPAAVDAVVIVVGFNLAGDALVVRVFLKSNVTRFSDDLLPAVRAVGVCLPSSSVADPALGW